MSFRWSTAAQLYRPWRLSGSTPWPLPPLGWYVRSSVRAQAANDLIVFGTVACTAFLSGFVHAGGGWAALNLSILPPLAVGLVADRYGLDVALWLLLVGPLALLLGLRRVR